MPTTFNDEELKLISRALNHYAASRNVDEAKNLATRIYRENFRIGMPNDKPRTLTFEEKVILNENYGKALAASHAVYNDADSLHIQPIPGQLEIPMKEFTLNDLFGNQSGLSQFGEVTKKCIECGSIVAGHQRHVEWHNKVADL